MKFLRTFFLQNISGRLLLTKALGWNCRILLRCYVDSAEFHQGLFYRKHFALLFIVGSKTRNDGRDALVWEFFCSRGGEKWQEIRISCKNDGDGRSTSIKRFL